jgi:hypothetical protein
MTIKRSLIILCLLPFAYMIGSGLYFQWRSPIAVYDESEFPQLVANRFKIGSPESELLREMSGQGFTRNFSARRVASLNRKFLVGFVFWAVEWEADGDGKLTKISGRMVDHTS